MPHRVPEKHLVPTNLNRDELARVAVQQILKQAKFGEVSPGTNLTTGIVDDRCHEPRCKSEHDDLGMAERCHHTDRIDEAWPSSSAFT